MWRRRARLELQWPTRRAEGNEQKPMPEPDAEGPVEHATRIACVGRIFRRLRQPTRMQNRTGERKRQWEQSQIFWTNPSTWVFRSGCPRPSTIQIDAAGTCGRSVSEFQRCRQYPILFPNPSRAWPGVWLFPVQNAIGLLAASFDRSP